MDSIDTLREMPRDRLLAHIERSVIGRNAVINGPVGPRQLVYCDYFASGRCLSFIEDAIRNDVLPFYANTHTLTTATATSTVRQRELGRTVIKRAVNAIMEKGHQHEAAVIFSGSGSTSCIMHLANSLHLYDAAYWDREHGTEPGSRPVVFISLQEHHSNILPWRESCADVVMIPDEPTEVGGAIDLKVLEEQLQRYSQRPLKIGSFTAGSNVTGTLSDTSAISILLHRFGAIACFDYAGVGPYVNIDMNPNTDVDPSLRYHKNETNNSKLSSSSSSASASGDSVNPAATSSASTSPTLPSSSSSSSNRQQRGGTIHSMDYKDAIFISPHKFIGGPGTPGVLVARKLLFAQRQTPCRPGGGSVNFVTKRFQVYHREVERREEAGTPAIIESIRCGMVFLLKDIVTPQLIEVRERAIAREVLARLKKNPAIMVLGSKHAERVPVFSIVIKRFALPNRLLHYNLVSQILNDLFGIQTRGGCMCAGPYTWELLGFNEKVIDAHMVFVTRETEKRGPRGGQPPSAESADDHHHQIRRLDGKGKSTSRNCGVGADGLGCATSVHDAMSGEQRQEDDKNYSKQEQRQDDDAAEDVNEDEEKEEPLLQSTLNLQSNLNSMKPGFVRFSLNYFSAPEDIEYVLKAIEWVAEHGWRLVPLYKIDVAKGFWTMRSQSLAEILGEFSITKSSESLQEMQGGGDRQRSALASTASSSSSSSTSSSSLSSSSSSSMSLSKGNSKNSISASNEAALSLDMNEIEHWREILKKADLEATEADNNLQPVASITLPCGMKTTCPLSQITRIVDTANDHHDHHSSNKSANLPAEEPQQQQQSQAGRTSFLKSLRSLLSSPTANKRKNSNKVSSTTALTTNSSGVFNSACAFHVANSLAENVDAILCHIYGMDGASAAMAKIGNIGMSSSVAMEAKAAFRRCEEEMKAEMEDYSDNLVRSHRWFLMPGEVLHSIKSPRISRLID